MQSQARHGTEPAAAGPAVVGALVVETGDGEAGRTGKGDWPQVQPPVLLQVGALREALATVQALVGTHTRVGQLVAAEVGQRSKSLATGMALEGPLARVRPQMVAHVNQLLEALATDTAAVSPLRGPVDRAPVPGEPGGGGKGLGALRAGQLGGWGRGQRRGRGLGRSRGGGRHRRCRGRCPALAGVSAPVVEELGHVAERFAAAAAVQWVGGVGPPVGHQRELCAEATATVHAEVAGFATVQPQVLLQ